MKKRRPVRYSAYESSLRENRIMRRTGTGQHYFTVRGRGFDVKQWREILRCAREIVDRAKKAGIKAKVEADAEHLVVSPEGDGRPLVIWRKGEPGIPKEITAKGPFDVVVQSVLVAAKKVDPDVLVLAAPDGRDYRRLLARAAPGESAWSRMKRLDQIPKSREEAFLKAMAKKKWRHPDTGNDVEFVSLPKSEQTKLRARWDQEYGDRYEKAFAKAQRETEEARREVEEAGTAVENLEKTKAKAEKRASDMDETTIRKAAIRVAATTEDPELKRKILTILKESAVDDSEKEGRHEEGKEVDIGTWLKQKGYDEAAAKWEEHEGEIGKKSSAAVVFPEVHKLAWHHVIDFSRSQPESKTASASTAARVATADRLAKKWIGDAIRRPERVHECLGVPKDEDIPMGKLSAAIEKRTGNKSLMAALQLAKRLKGDIGKKKAEVEEQDWLTEENFRVAAEDFFGAEHMAKKWISDAIKRPGRVREYLGIPEGKDIPMGKLNAAIEKVKGTGNKSLLSALILAKRLKGGLGKKAEATA